jgi:ATP-dependent Lhr-like helicase
VHGRLRGTKRARLRAILSGGAIPDTAQYRVVLEPEGDVVGTLDEDFAIESSAGDVFQLGNASWRVLRVGAGAVRVADAHGAPPSLPFWLGEAPARTRELSHELALVRERGGDPAWTESECRLTAAAAAELAAYLNAGREALGAVPTQERIVLERFFDESGGAQLVVHAPFGGRINRALGLALRKRFCRRFGFELQAAANEEAILISLGPHHSFPLGDVFRFLSSKTAREVLVQAALPAPMFTTRWRWNVTRSLLLPRTRGGKRVPAPLLRMRADDLLVAAFPEVMACGETLPPGDLPVPLEHPIVRQTVEDCLHEIMDVDGLLEVLAGIESGAIETVALDRPEPSPFALGILSSQPYTFLDDAPLEERRAQAVYTRRAFEPSSADDLGALDPAAIERVREEVWPEVQNADELHDALLTSGFLTEAEGSDWAGNMDELVQTGRAERVEAAHGRPAVWVTAERRAEVDLLADAAAREPAVRELVRGRLGIVGPTTAAALGATLGVSGIEVEAALVALESEGVVLRGRFSPRDGDAAADLEWCERRLLARIHRYTLNRLRSEIEPVSPADFMRFLFAWQRVDPEHRAAGLEGLAAIVGQLDGFEVPAAAWESDVLAARVEEYDPALLDTLSLTGRVGWAAGRRGGGSAPPIRSTPIALFAREHGGDRLADRAPAENLALSTYPARVREVLERRGASFFHELAPLSGLLPTQVEHALGELAGLGMVTSDSFAGLRALITPSSKRKPLGGGRRRHRTAPFGIESAGRWSLVNRAAEEQRQGGPDPVELAARSLLRRYGVVFKRVLAKEAGAPPWRELLLVYRRLEGRGEVRGGRFVSGMSGEQFALPEAVGQLRAVRRQPASGRLVAVGAGDPLNLTGIITPGERVAAVARSRVLYRDGVPVLALERGEVKPLAAASTQPTADMVEALVRKRLTPALRARLGISGVPAASMPDSRRLARRASQRKVASRTHSRDSDDSSP